MTKPILIGLACFACLHGSATAGEAKLVRYPDYHGGKVAFATWETSGPPTKMGRTSTA